MHEDTGLFACAKGRLTKEATRLRLECPKQIEDDLKIMRDDFLLNKKSQMLVMISMATDEMIRLVAMYPDMWFWILQQVSVYTFLVYELNDALYFVSVCPLNYYLDISFK